MIRFKLIGPWSGAVIFVPGPPPALGIPRYSSRLMSGGSGHPIDEFCVARVIARHSSVELERRLVVGVRSRVDLFIRRRRPWREMKGGIVDIGDDIFAYDGK